MVERSGKELSSGKYDKAITVINSSNCDTFGDMQTELTGL